MKKIFTILCLMALTVGVQAQSSDYSGIEISFNKSAATEANFTNVSVVVKDLDGKVLTGVTAEAVSQEGGELVNSSMGNVAALSWTTGSIIGARYNNNNYPSGNSSNYVVKISGLRSGFTYNKADVDVYGVNRTGGIVNNSAVKMSLGIQTGNSVENLSDFVSSTDNTIHDGSQEGGLMHKISSMISSTTKTVAEGEDLYVNVIIQKTADNGTQCRPCFRTVKLSQLPTVSVTYILQENETEVKRVVVNQEQNSSVSVPAELTSGYYASAYTFPTSGTIGTTDCTITVTATPNTGVVTNLANLSNDKVYTLVTRRGALSTDGSAVNTNTSGGTPHFGIVKYGSDYYLWSVNDSKWVKNDGTLTANVADIATSSKLVVTATNVRNNLKPLFFMGVGNNGLNTNAGGHCAVNSYTTRDDGNEFIITEVADADGTAYAALEAYFNPSHTITYVVKDANDNELLRETLPTELGEEITELPDALKRAYTSYTYPDAPLTITGNSHTFNAVATFDLPFETFTSFENAKWYNVNIRNTKYMAYANADKYPNAAATWTQKASDEYQWAFKGNPYDGIQVYNKATGASKTLKLTGTSNKAAITMQDGEYGWVIAAGSGAAAGGFVLYDGATGFLHDHAEGLSVWNSTAALSDAGSRLFVQEAPLAEANYFIADLANLSNDKVYTVHNTPRAMWTFTANSMGADPLTGIDIIAEANNPAAKHQIAIVKQNDKYYLYSVEQGKYLASNNKLYLSPIEAVSITESSYTEKGPEYKWFFNFEGYTDRNINTNGSPAIEINYWNTKDYGNTNAIMETTATYDLNTALAAFNDYTQCITDYCDLKSIDTGFASHIGELGYPKAGTTATTAFTEILARNISGENTETDWTTFVDKYNAMIASENIVLPEVGKFYRIKTAKAWSETNAEKFNNTQPYLIGENASNNRAAFSTTAGEDASSIWYLTTIGESPTQYLVNFSNGRPAVKNSDFLGVGKDAQFLSTHGTSIVFKAATNGEIGAYGIVFAAGTRALYTNVNLYTDAAGADGSGAGYNFELEEVTSLPVTMHDGQDGRYYATFSAPVAISSITGATAHKVKVENEKAKYSETGVEGIPAGTGVLLINETGDDAMLTIGDFTDAIDTDLQHIFAAETSHEGLFFGLSTENKLGFFKLMEGGETAPTTGGFKAYLDGAVTPAGAKGVELVADNEATGVEAIDNSEFAIDNAPVYNLQGQRVNKAQKGVFIQNGKKVVVK